MPVDLTARVEEQKFSEKPAREAAARWLRRSSPSYSRRFPVATFITEIRDDIDHAERKEGLVGTWRRPGITELLALNKQGSDI